MSEAGEPCILERRTRRFEAEGRGSFVFCRDMTLPDAGALDDPLVRRVQCLFEIGVADNP